MLHLHLFSRDLNQNSGKPGGNQNNGRRRLKGRYILQEDISPLTGLGEDII
jgi:hypothetical protein